MKFILIIFLFYPVFTSFAQETFSYKFYVKDLTTKKAMPRVKCLVTPVEYCSEKNIWLSDNMGYIRIDFKNTALFKPFNFKLTSKGYEDFTLTVDEAIPTTNPKTFFLTPESKAEPIVTTTTKAIPPLKKTLSGQQRISIKNNVSKNPIEKFISASNLKAYYLKIEAPCDSILSKKVIKVSSLSEYLKYLEGPNCIEIEKKVDSLWKYITIKRDVANDSLSIIFTLPSFKVPLNYFSISMSNSFIKDSLLEFSNNWYRDNDSSQRYLHNGVFYYTERITGNQVYFTYKIKKNK